MMTRRRCCCGGPPIPKCYNWCSPCGEDVWLTSGTVTDDLGTHPLVQPTTFNAPWASAPIPFTTTSFSGGGCSATTGTAYYRYWFYCSESAGLGLLRVTFGAVDCGGGTWLYNGSAPFPPDSGPTSEASFSFDCETLSGSFTVPEFNGLDAPWLAPTLTLEQDAAAIDRCRCRSCFIFTDDDGATTRLFPHGDIRVIYDFTDGGTPYGGEATLHVRDVLSSWIGVVPGWPGTPCTADGANNVVFDCGSGTGAFSFLRWCNADIRYKAGYSGNITFDLMDSGVSQGTITIKDPVDFDPGRICCGPCDIPQKDFDYTITRSGGGGGTATFRLVYSATPYTIPNSPTGSGTVTATHWRSEPVSTPFLPLTPTSVAYFDCSVSFTGTDFGLAVILLNSTAGRPYGWTGASTGGGGLDPGEPFSCDPYHFEGGNGATTTWTLDEVE